MQQKVLPEVLVRQETAQQKELQRELEVKFNIAHNILVKEELSFTKYRPLLLLSYKMNGVDIGPTYSDIKCAEFISAICDGIKSDPGDLLETWKYASICNNIMKL